MMNENEEDLSKTMYIKIVLAGASASGKTSLIQRYIDKNFRLNQKTTIGIQFERQEVIKDDTIMKINIMDTAGQEKYQALGTMFYRNAVGALVVFDVTDKKSFDRVKKCINEIKEMAHKDCVIIVVGNKCDLEDERVIMFQDAQDFAMENKLRYIETSAKDNINVAKTFDDLIEMIYEEFKEENDANSNIEDNRESLDQRQSFRQNIVTLESNTYLQKNNRAKDISNKCKC